MFAPVVSCDAIRHIYVPQYEGLSVKTMQEEANRHAQVAVYLPDPKELPKVPR